MSKRLKRQVIRAVPWSVAESVVNGLAGLALTFTLAWLLEPIEVGQATIALAVVGTIELVAELGMAEALVSARSGHTRVSDTAFSAVVVLGLVAAAMSWFLAGPIGRFYAEPHIAELLHVAAFILPVNALGAIPTAMFVRKMRAAAVTLRMMTTRVVTIGATAVLAFLGYGAWSLVLGTLAGSCAALAVVLPMMSRWPRLRFSAHEFKNLIIFGAPFSIERLMWGVMTRLFWLVLGFVHGPVILGYFQFAQRLIDETANLVQTFALRFGLSLFSALERAGRDPTEAFLKATRLITAAAAPIFVGLAMVMPDLIAAIFASKWASATIVGQVAALGWIVAFPRVLVGPVLRARGRQGGLVLYGAIATGVTVIAAALTAGHGLLIIGLAWIVRHLIGVPWSLYAIRRYLGVPVSTQISAALRPILAAGIMAVVVFGVGDLMQGYAPMKRLIAEVAIGAVTYVLTLALIDRATTRLLRDLAVDVWQLRSVAR